MEQVYKSASKIVFIMLSATACSGFLLGMLDTANFMILATSAFSFYFAAKDKVAGQITK